MNRMRAFCLFRMIFVSLIVPRALQGFRLIQVGSSRTRLSPRVRSLCVASFSSRNGQVDNPTVEWKGSSHSTSEFVTHVLGSTESKNQTIGDAVEHVLRERATDSDEDTLTAVELLDMGSVWYLPASAPRDPSLGIKPSRLTSEQYNQQLEESDYLRVHHHPRRFKAVYDFDWDKRLDDHDSEKPGVIVDEDKSKGWLVIDKPARVPVHMTVDNCRENVQSCIVAARQKDDAEKKIYVTTPQRLDQNTSGLLVLATTPTFAAYFAQLLRNKTSLQLLNSNKDFDQEKKDDNHILGGVHKMYKCLVCIQPPPQLSTDNAEWSVGKAWRDLHGWSKDGEIIRHYLEPSIRAPKNFVKEPPPNAEDKDAWLESLLRIKSVGPLFTLLGNKPSERLASALWGENEYVDTTTSPPARMPRRCQAITEIQVELLTGRTHQIRGQLAAMGFALVGDVQYGGAEVFQEGDQYKSLSYERLALQCCQLEFIEPDVVVNEKDGVTKLRRSNRWKKFSLERAWWTIALERYTKAIEMIDSGDVTTGSDDYMGLLVAPRISGKTFKSTSRNALKPPRPDLLPDRVQLSPGKNKYVLIRATHPLEPATKYWFVKSAAPAECGGQYHGNVAQDLREWIEAAGYDVKITGGGRIDYSPDEGRCVVYGFSYGFGKGDHELAAQIIREDSEGLIQATADNTDGLY
eukprot:scaffold4017_cov180-Amphora_coffeaeformis.AAC.4